MGELESAIYWQNIVGGVFLYIMACLGSSALLRFCLYEKEMEKLDIDKQILSFLALISPFVLVAQPVMGFLKLLGIGMSKTLTYMITVADEEEIVKEVIRVVLYNGQRHELLVDPLEEEFKVLEKKV